MSPALSLPAVRISLAGLASILVTFLLFFLMQDLIKNSLNTVPEDSSPGYKLEFIRIIKDTPPEKKEPVKPPAMIEKPPPTPQLREFENPEIESTQITIGKIETTIETGGERSGTIFIGEGDILPVYKVSPEYPVNARTQGIEGYVIVEFTVTARGTTADIKVIEAFPDNIFNRSAILAAAKFKYKPRVIDGTAVDVTGVQNKFIFNLE